MRSEVVFRAQKNLSNPYQLCRITAKMTRLFHSFSTSTNDAITDAFVYVAHSLEEESQPICAVSKEGGHTQAW